MQLISITLTVFLRRISQDYLDSYGALTRKNTYYSTNDLHRGNFCESTMLKLKVEITPQTYMFCGLFLENIVEN